MTGIASGNNGTRQRVSLAEIEAAANRSSSNSSSSSSSSSSAMTMPSKSKNRGSDCNPVPRSTPITLSEVLLALDETLEERDRRIHHLFRFFDVSGKGFLDHSDIEKGFDALDIPTQYKYAKDLLDVCDSNRDDRVDFKEFSGYMDSKELELYTIFRDIDVKHHGCIKPEELSAALQNSGIHLNAKELNQFVEHIDKDNNGIISFREWRDFLLLYPHAATIANIYQYWEKVSLADMAAVAAAEKETGNGVRAEAQPPQQHVQAAKYFLAGGVAGALSRTATAPLDRLKVLLQVERDHHGSVQQRGRARILPCVLKMYREGGFMGFFRGNGINVIKVAPESAIKFYSYEMMKDVVVSVDGLGSKEDISGMGRLFAGGTAGAIAQTAIYPMDLIKTRLQTFTSVDGRAPSAVKLSKDIWQQEGPRAFYRGLLPSLIGMIPYAGIDLAAYESLKNVSRQWLPEDHEPGPLIQVCCGMISGALGATCVYPLQLVRTRLQAQPMNSQNRYTGMIDVFRRTYREEGLLAFYKGLFPNLLKVIPAASITYMAYEEMKSQLGL